MTVQNLQVYGARRSSEQITRIANKRMMIDAAQVEVGLLHDVILTLSVLT